MKVRRCSCRQISPLRLRGAVTAAAGFSYTFGPFIVTLLQNSYGGLHNRWAYRGIFVSQYGVTVLGLIGLPFMPECERQYPFNFDVF